MPYRALSKYEVERADAGAMPAHDASALLSTSVEPLRQGSAGQDRHYIVGRFSAWEGKCRSALKLGFDDAHDAFVLYLPSTNAPEIRAGTQSLPTTRATGFLEDLAHFDELTPHEHSTSEKGLRLAALGHLVWSCLNLSEADRLSPAAIERLFQATMIALLEVAPNSYMPRLERSLSPAVPWQVKRAIEYMHSNLAQSMTVALIAAETGTSVRALQAAFQRFKGTTPLGYLRTIRLEAARRALLGDGGSRSISDAARNAGFTHMGRFAAAYYQAFGETPSETLRMR